MKPKLKIENKRIVEHFIIHLLMTKRYFDNEVSLKFCEWLMTYKKKTDPSPFHPSLPPLLPSPWVIPALRYPPFVWPCRRGTDVLIHQNRTAPFTGWTPASKAAPPAGANSCPPVLNTRPPRARADPQRYQWSFSRSNSVDCAATRERSVKNNGVRRISMSVPGTHWLSM